jgi:hypothetical protein
MSLVMPAHKWTFKSRFRANAYEPTTLDMNNAYQHLMNASAKCGRTAWAQAEDDRLIANGTSSDRQEFLTALVAGRQRQP